MISDTYLLAIATTCFLTAAIIIAAHLRTHLPALTSIHLPRRYHPRHRAVISRRLVFALPVKVVAA